MPARRASPKPLRTYRRRKRSRSACRRKREGRCPPPPIAPHLPTDQGASAPEPTHHKYRERRQRPRRSCARLLQAFRPDRKSVVSGKDVSGRVDLGGRRNIKKKKNNKPQQRA